MPRKIYLPEKEVKNYLDFMPEQVYCHRIMNRLATDKRIAVVAALVEGTSINATWRVGKFNGEVYSGFVF
jgi:hypothetical protein